MLLLATVDSMKRQSVTLLQFCIQTSIAGWMLKAEEKNTLGNSPSGNTFSMFAALALYYEVHLIKK